MTAKVENITLIENFDPEKAYILLERYKEVCDYNPEFYDEFAAKNLRFLRKYLTSSYNGTARVTYSYKKGRYYAVTPSMQSMKAEFRQTICKHYYYDLDIVNSGPTILYEIYKNLLFQVKDMEAPEGFVNTLEPTKLKYYIENREDCLNHKVTLPSNFKRSDFKLWPTKKPNELDRDDMKQIFTCICNGSTKLAPTFNIGDGNKSYEYFKALKDEIDKVFKNICLSSKYRDEYQEFKKEYNEDKKTEGECYGKFVSKLVYDTERRIIMTIHNYYDKLNDCVLTFDGIQIPKTYTDLLKDANDKDKDNNHKESKLSEIIRLALGINIKFKIKDMNRDLSLNFPDSELIVYTPPRIEFASDYKNLCGDGFVTSQYVLEIWAHNTFSYIINGAHPRILEKQYNQNTIAKESTEDYEIKDYDKDFLKMYKRECRVYNDSYDAQFRKKYNHVGQKNPIREDPRFNKYKFKYLSEFLEYMYDKNKLRTYDKVEFIPYLKHIKPNIPNCRNNFNIFTGFAFDTGIEYPQINVENSIFIKHLKEQLCNNDEKVYNWVLGYLADIIQNPATLPGTGILFYSQEGTGKSMLVKFMRALLGMKYAVSITKIDKYIETGFNSFSVCKLIKCFEEVAEEGAHKTKFGVLKGEMTDENERLENKGKNAVEVNNFARLIFNTNVRYPFYVDPSNRRLVLIKSSNTYAQNIEYFTPIWNQIKDRRFLQAAFNWLARRDLSNFKVREVIVTDYAREQKDASLPSCINMLIEYIERRFATENLHAEDLKADWRQTIVKKDYAVKSVVLSTLFKQNFSGTINGMKKKFIEYGIPEINMRFEADESPTTGYLLYPPEIERIFKEKLKDDDWKFVYIVDEDEEKKEVPKAAPKAAPKVEDVKKINKAIDNGDENVYADNILDDLDINRV